METAQEISARPVPPVGHASASARVLSSSAQAAEVVCVDMDGTLLATDVLWESLLALFRKQPWTIMLFPAWLLRGKAYFKHQVAQRVALDPTILPYREEVVAFLRRETESGRQIILATAADRTLAESVARHLNMFTTILASDGKKNLAGRRKLSALKLHIGERSFAYLGNSKADLPLWGAASTRIVVNPGSRLLGQVRRLGQVEEIASPRTNAGKSLWRALRVNQWAKNILLFVPLLTSHRVVEPGLLFSATAAFLAFSLCASAGYIINDLVDLEADRRHAMKKHRPFAAGALPISTGLLLAPLLLMGGFTIAAILAPSMVAATLALYVLTSAAYSLYLKRVLGVDVLVLAGLYTFRVLAGGVATGISISQWLLAFSMFFFLSLAIVKRYTELSNLAAAGQRTANGRAYLVSDRDLLRSFGVTSGYLSVLVLALYINSEAVTLLYRHPQVLWLLCPLLLFWITRAWFLADRREIHEDPVVFALRDLVSYGILGMVGLVALAAV